MKTYKVGFYLALAAAIIMAVVNLWLVARHPTDKPPFPTAVKEPAGATGKAVLLTQEQKKAVSQTLDATKLFDAIFDEYSSSPFVDDGIKEYMKDLGTQYPMALGVLQTLPESPVREALDNTVKAYQNVVLVWADSYRKGLVEQKELDLVVNLWGLESVPRQERARRLISIARERKRDLTANVEKLPVAQCR